MELDERLKKQKELVEEMGRFYDKQGLQPVAARILALLIVMDKEKYTFNEIVEELSISKSSASNALHNLEISKAVEYVTFSGDRKRYFQLRKLNKFALLDDMYEKLKSSKSLLEAVLNLKADKSSENSQFFRSIIEMIDYSLGELTQLKNKFQDDNL